MELKTISPEISYIPSSLTPLSAEAVIIKGNNSTYLFDVGRDIDVCNYIKELGDINIILSHFHGDHTENIRNLTFNKLYVSKQTLKYTHTGILVTEDTFIDDDDLHLRIVPLPSSHSKGCLCLEVNKKYVFVGDATYGNPNKNKDEEYNYQLLQAEIKTIKDLDGEIFFMSHRFNQSLSKKKVLSFLGKHLIK